MNRLGLAPLCKFSSAGLFLANLAVADNHHIANVGLTKSLLAPNSKIVDRDLTPELEAKKLNEEGVDLVVKGFADSGVELFKKGLQLDPNNSTLRYNLAGVYFSRGDIENALNESARSVELKPDDLSFLHRLGEVHFAAKNFSEAAKIFEKIAELNPEFNEVVFHLGTVYAMQQNWPLAENALRRAREIYPSHSSIDMNLANVLIMTRKFNEAAEILEKVSQSEPSAESNLALGIAYEGAGQSKKAMLAYQVARSLGSKDPHLEERISALQKR